MADLEIIDVELSYPRNKCQYCNCTNKRCDNRFEAKITGYMLGEVFTKTVITNKYQSNVGYEVGSIVIESLDSWELEK